MKAHLMCPRCGHKWIWDYWKWVLKAPFHMFDFKEWRDYRKTKCPVCEQKSWIFRNK
jgi:DNA-directed RNA polymerase subunit RPC12/RpoP